MQHTMSADVVELIKQDAAERTGVTASRWVVVAQSSMQWTDTSLGVREPGVMYGRIMVPGHRVVLRNGRSGDREVIYHTGFSGAYKYAREQRATGEREVG